MHKSLMGVFVLGFVFAGCEEEPKPENPPEIGAASITCKEPRRGGEYPEFGEIAIAISDVERDLVPASIKGTINGIPMDGFADPDADEKFTWSPPAETEPPMICRGEFTLVVEAADLGGRISTKTLTVSP